MKKILFPLIFLFGPSLMATNYRTVLINTDTGQFTESFSLNVSTQATRTSNVSMAGSNTWTNIIYLSVSSGTWLVSGVVLPNSNLATVTNSFGVISAYSGNTTTDHVYGINQFSVLTPAAGNQSDYEIVIPGFIYTVNTDTTLYLKGYQTYGSGSPYTTGRITAIKL